jgi:hypothetical protein
MSHSTYVDTYIYMSSHSYEYIYAHHIYMSITERLGWLDLKIHEAGQKASHCQQECRLSLKE